MAYGGMGLVACGLQVHRVGGRLWHGPVASRNRSYECGKVRIGFVSGPWLVWVVVQCA